MRFLVRNPYSKHHTTRPPHSTLRFALFHARRAFNLPRATPTTTHLGTTSADPSLVSGAFYHRVRRCKQHLAFATLQRPRGTISMLYHTSVSVPLQTSSAHEGLPHYHATQVRPCTHYHAQSPACPPLALAPHYALALHTIAHFHSSTTTTAIQQHNGCLPR